MRKISTGTLALTLLFVVSLLVALPATAAPKDNKPVAWINASDNVKFCYLDVYHHQGQNVEVKLLADGTTTGKVEMVDFDTGGTWTSVAFFNDFTSFDPDTGIFSFLALMHLEQLDAYIALYFQYCDGGEPGAGVDWFQAWWVIDDYTAIPIYLQTYIDNVQAHQAKED